MIKRDNITQEGEGAVNRVKLLELLNNVIPIPSIPDEYEVNMIINSRRLAKYNIRLEIRRRNIDTASMYLIDALSHIFQVHFHAMYAEITVIIQVIIIHASRTVHV